MQRSARRAVLDKLTALDHVADAAGSSVPVPLVRREITRIVSSLRGLLDEHSPNSQGRCPVCSHGFKRRKWPCDVWLTAHRQLIGEGGEDHLPAVQNRTGSSRRAPRDVEVVERTATGDIGPSPGARRTAPPVAASGPEDTASQGRAARLRAKIAREQRAAEQQAALERTATPRPAPDRAAAAQRAAAQRAAAERAAAEQAAAERAAAERASAERAAAERAAAERAAQRAAAERAAQERIAAERAAADRAAAQRAAAERAAAAERVAQQRAAQQRIAAQRAAHEQALRQSGPQHMPSPNGPHPISGPQPVRRGPRQGTPPQTPGGGIHRAAVIERQPTMPRPAVGRRPRY